MLAMINRLLEWFKSLFWKEEMELTLVNLLIYQLNTTMCYLKKTLFLIIFYPFEYLVYQKGCPIPSKY